MRPWRFLLAVVMLLPTACANEPDAETSALLAKYDLPATLTGWCEWKEAKVGPPVTIRGFLRPGDEHIPDWFEALPKQKLPSIVRNGAFAFAFKKGHPGAELGKPVIAKGRLATGSFRCSGSANMSWPAVLLIDQINLAPEVSNMKLNQ